MPSFRRRLAFTAALALSLGSTPLWGDIDISPGFTVSASDTIITDTGTTTIQGTLNIARETNPAPGWKANKVISDGTDPSYQGLVNVTVSGPSLTGILATTDGFEAKGGAVTAKVEGGGSIGIRITAGGFTATADAAITVNAENGGYGVYVADGGFTATGSSVTAKVEGDDSIGIRITAGGFTATADAAITASAGSGGFGLDVEADGFTAASSSVTASAEGDGVGIRVQQGGFMTTDSRVTAVAEGGGYGISVVDGGFTATGSNLNLASAGDGLAIWLDSDPAVFRAEAGSIVTLGTVGRHGAISSPTIDAGGAELRLLAAGTQDTLARVYTVAGEVSTVLSHFSPADSPAFSYRLQLTDEGLYQVTVIRRAFASEADPGLIELENFLLGQAGQTIWPDEDPNSLWALAQKMHEANHDPAVGDWRYAQRKLTRQSSPQATGQALPQMTEAGRLAAKLFNRKLALTREAGGLQPAYGGGSGAASLWLSPFYLHTKREAPSAEFNEVKSDWWGASLGAALSPNDRFTWGLGFHLLKGDFEGGSDYEADSEAWGLDFGLAARLGRVGGNFRPTLSAVFSHTSHNLDQTRRVRGGSHHSSPDVKVTGLALALSQDFYLNQNESLSLSPRLGLDWFHTSLGDYRESGPAGWALEVDGSSINSVRSELGTALNWRPTESLELELRAAWLHEFGDRQQPLSSRLRALPAVELAVPQSQSGRD